MITSGALALLVHAAQAQPVPPDGLRHNEHFIAPPSAGEDWQQWLARAQSYRQARWPLYERADLKWTSRNFVCGFLNVYDRDVWDPEQQKYKVEELSEKARKEFGGYDSVVFWHAYPRIGADERNQFDFFRDLPGGIAGVRDLVQRLHNEGIKVFIPYNPWDTGTRREGESDNVALAKMVAAIDADGVFLDTMRQVPEGLRKEVDARRMGVAFESEAYLAFDEMQHCSASWFKPKWQVPYPGIGMLRLKWLEPRHMQHQSARWLTSHQQELAVAWLNGSGILVWENVFGTWNPWNTQDRATLRRMGPVWRQFAEVLSDGQWLPCWPGLPEKVYASCWQGDGVRLWTLLNDREPQGTELNLELDDRGERFFDLWRGIEIQPQRLAGKVRLSMQLDRYGAIAAVQAPTLSTSFVRLVEGLHSESQRPAIKAEADPHGSIKSVVEPKAPPACRATAATTTGMLQVDGGRNVFSVRHLRRECGCYPDPGTSSDAQATFLKGDPPGEMMSHHITIELAAYWIDPRPITNAQFEAFVLATRYKPACNHQFLAHWKGPTCPAEMRDQPVVFIDLEDARAYAAWAGKRLPTEWEWQRGAELFGERFAHSDVHEWTESERDDGHNRFVMLRGGCCYQAAGSKWYFPGGPQPVESHLKFPRLYPGLDRCSTIGFRCAVR